MANTPPAKRIPKKKSNPLRQGQHIDYKDFQSLRRYLSDKGKIRSRRITGACRRHQNQLANAVKRARELALLPYVSER